MFTRGVVTCPVPGVTVICAQLLERPGNVYRFPVVTHAIRLFKPPCTPSWESDLLIGNGLARNLSTTTRPILRDDVHRPRGRSEPALDSLLLALANEIWANHNSV